MENEAYLNHFHIALRDEIEAIRSGGGQKTHLSDGHYLGEKDGRHIYSFTADTEVNLPDDTDCDLEYRGRKYEGLLISAVGFDLVLGLFVSIGDPIQTAILHTEPWYLLQELQKRLEGLRHAPEQQTSLSWKLLSKYEEGKESDLDQAQVLLEQIKQRGHEVAYNEYQLEAVGHVLSNEVSFIWGPPGTGKTTTLGMVAAALVERGESVLIVAHSNVAVDVATVGAIKKLMCHPLYPAGYFLRYGVTYLPEVNAYPFVHIRGILRQQNPELIKHMELLEGERKRLIQLSRQEKLGAADKKIINDRLDKVKNSLSIFKEELKEKEQQLLQKAQLIACTLSKATISQNIFQRSFDAVLIDEASMAYIPHCAFVSSLASKRVAVFGDFRQLAPIAQGNTHAVTRWLQRDIFDEAGIIARISRLQSDKRLVLLARQYRMHPRISAIPNKLFYSGRLENAAGLEQKTAPIVGSPPVPDAPLVYYDLTPLNAWCFSEPESHSRFNFVSALLTVALAQQARQAGQRIGIVTPYNAQSRLIHRLLSDLKIAQEEIMVATVHRFQGSERDVILFDVVEGEPAKPGRLVNSTEDSGPMRLANVAVSRAKGKFITVANAHYIKNNLPLENYFRQLFAEVERKVNPLPVTWPVQKSIADWNAHLPGITVYDQCRHAKTIIEQDLLLAQEEIAIVWPARLNNFHFSLDTLKRLNPHKVRLFISGAGSEHFHIGLQNTEIYKQRRLHMPYGIIAIDRKRLWVYLQPELAIQPVIHIQLSQTSKLLYGFWKLVLDNEFKQKTIEEQLEQGITPFSPPCPHCGQFLYIESGKYGVYLRCVNPECGHRKPVTENDATAIARFHQIICEKCGGPVAGRKGHRGVFLACTNYPSCKWTKDLSVLV